MSAFICYFDASGTQHDQVALVMAGFMSTAESWLEFEQAWLGRLRESGLRHFHRKELRLDKYSGLLEDLAGIAREFAMHNFGMVVRVKALHDTVSKDIYDKFHLDAYSYAGRACAAHVKLWANKNRLRQIPRIVFATGDTGRNQLEERLRKDGYTGISFEPAIEYTDKKTKLVVPAAVPLQAADLFAYEMFKPTREIETQGTAWGTYGRKQLSPVWFILDKIPGEPRVTEDAGFSAFEERLKNFTGDNSSLVKLATWMPTW
jgi:hypothetical protein